MRSKEVNPTPLSLFEFWPGSVFYTPIVLYWIVMGLKYRDFSTPTAANPRIETGGLCGEQKSSILDMAGQTAKQYIAPYAVFKSGEGSFQRAQHAMARINVQFPVVIKPNIGCNGTGVKLVQSLEILKQTLSLFPDNVDLMVQELVDYPIEVGAFYIRHPDQEKGYISSLTYKETPALQGDGQSTLKQLIMHDPRMQHIPHVYLPRIAGLEETILPAGEKKSLVFAGNHCKGSIFRDARTDRTVELTECLDAIMKDIPDFHFGRIDLKTPSIEDLKQGKNLKIIEINGVGSEAIHIWDRRTTIWEAYRAQFSHYRQTFIIGAKNKSRGWKTSGAFNMLFAWRKQKRLLASYPTND
ncbi:ATP-grasp domain-containing protein [Swingsia samuiensis]|uniref:ATP-grasp domain-containing protein n=1 Tax=Swingsia samuiensis TaxID=1293412 RepID=A0A4Y6UF46_9PROT|nr:ATP-grasp domain-containing protein [Swingsia samuiensis]QDH16152.1 ATP-grasp domain-containing protein [Swingsia samuiensis]